MNKIRGLITSTRDQQGNALKSHQTKKKIRNLTKEKINMIILTSKLIKLSYEELINLIEDIKQDIEENKKNGN